MQNSIGSWLESLKHYLLMCLFLSGPEDLPHNPNCITLTLASYFAIGLLLVDEQRGYGLVCAQILLEMMMLGGIAYAVLRWKKILARLVQTFSALLGINLVITAATIPVYRALADRAETEQMLVYATIAILIWNLAVLSLIFKRAFEISTHLAAMISFNYFVLYQFIVFWLY